MVAQKKKQITADLLAAAGKFCLSEDIRDFVREWLNEREEHEYNRQLQKKIHMMLFKQK